jgi:hypothetical protein
VAEIAADAVVTVEVEAEIAEAEVVIEMTAAQGASDETSITTADHVRTVQTEMAKVAEIVARGDKPVAMMEAAVDLARRADAKHF